MGKPLVSVIIPCKNEGVNIRNTIRSIRENSGKVPYELIVVDDGSEDGCCEFLKTRKKKEITLITTPEVYGNRARNKGAEKAQGNIFVFCDAHIFAEKDWLDKLIRPLSVSGVGAVSPGIRPHDTGDQIWGGLTWQADMSIRWLLNPPEITPVPVLPRSCMAVSRAAFDAVGGFDSGFRVYGYEDVEFTLKLWLFGFGAYINPDVTVRHIFRSSPPPYKICAADLDANLLRLAYLHFSRERLAGIIGRLKTNQGFPEIFTEVILGNAPELREKYFAGRVHSDDWFIKKFDIPL